jgi:hypothetical protein
MYKFNKFQFSSCQGYSKVPVKRCSPPTIATDIKFIPPETVQLVPNDDMPIRNPPRIGPRNEPKKQEDTYKPPMWQLATFSGRPVRCM